MNKQLFQCSYHTGPSLSLSSCSCNYLSPTMSVKSNEDPSCHCLFYDLQPPTPGLWMLTCIVQGIFHGFIGFLRYFKKQEISGLYARIGEWLCLSFVFFGALGTSTDDCHASWYNLSWMGKPANGHCFFWSEIGYNWGAGYEHKPLLASYPVFQSQTLSSSDLKERKRKKS